MLLLTLWLVGCSTFPDKIKVEDRTKLVSYQDAASKAEQVKGQLLRWGGAIAKIENKEKSTLLELVYYPLTSYGRPITGDESMGRFRISVDGFMDPMVYQVGRLMTFTAQLEGLEDGLVGEAKYVFPKAHAKAYHLWRNIQRVNINSVHIWPYDYWYGHFPRLYPRRLIIRTSGPNHHSGNQLNSSSRSTTVPKVTQQTHK
jgi:outer membrane lipoprotein